MLLHVTTEADALVFSSDRYFAKILGCRIYVPRWLTPGQMRVSHTDFGEGWFEFRLTLTHQYFGRLLDQRAMFCDDGEF